MVPADCIKADGLRGGRSQSQSEATSVCRVRAKHIGRVTRESDDIASQRPWPPNRWPLAQRSGFEP
jgi:hypothetical protein